MNAIKNKLKSIETRLSIKEPRAAVIFWHTSEPDVRRIIASGYHIVNVVLVSPEGIETENPFYLKHKQG